MALIKCPECGNDVSDKATTCPHCGNPINKGEEQIICCPACGSSDIFTTQQGFSGLKAAAGVVTVGAIGALVGTHGSKDITFACKKCGHVFSIDEAKREYSGAIVNGVQEKLEDKVLDIYYRKGASDAADYYRKKTGVSALDALSYVSDLSIKIKERKIDEEENLTTFEKEKKKLELRKQSEGCVCVLLFVFAVSMFISLVIFL